MNFKSFEREFHHVFQLLLLLHVFLEKTPDLFFPPKAADGNKGRNHSFVVNRVESLKHGKVGPVPVPQERDRTQILAHDTDGDELVSIGHLFQHVSLLSL